MSTLTYTIIMIALFIIGAFIFGYFETPVEALKNRLNSFDRGVRNLGKINILKLNKKNDNSLIVGLPGNENKSDQNTSGDLKIFVHEY